MLLDTDFSATLGALHSASPILPLLLLLSVPVGVAFYRLYFGPLAHIPGPPFAGVSSLFLYAICYWGIEGRVLLYYHQKYNTTVLRVSPDSVSISDGEALHSIYVARGGLPKDARYQNFRVEGHDTIFSALDTTHRDKRAKAVLPLFSPGKIRSSYEQGIGRKLTDQFIDALRSEREEAMQAGAATKRKSDILDLSSRVSLDFLTGYLFSKVYGGLNEKDNNTSSTASATKTPEDHWMKKLSATPFVLVIVSFSRFSLFPNWLFTLVFSLLVGSAMSKKEVASSLATVSGFVNSILDAGKDTTAAADNDTYQSRLLGAGISHEETLIQCKAAMFAGADSTALMLATTLFHLIRRPEIRQRVKEEVENRAPGVDVQSLPYLRAVIREGLRLGMANPARLTRVVPKNGPGFTVNGFFLPPGTIVGAAPYVIHHNEKVFPQPFEFVPERWLETEEQSVPRRLKESHFLPFGLGQRACVGRNLANQQLHGTVARVVESNVLEGAVTCAEKIELIEWFNAEIKGHELVIEWPSAAGKN